MYADSYGGIRGGISCTGRRPPYSKLNVYVQPVLGPKFVIFSSNAWTVPWILMCIFIWLYSASCCAFVSSMAKPSRMVSCVAFDLCAPCHFNSMYHFCGRPYQSHFMLLWPLFKEGQLGRLKNDNHINISATILLQNCTNSYCLQFNTLLFDFQALFYWVVATLVFIHTEDDAIMTDSACRFTHSSRQ